MKKFIFLLVLSQNISGPVYAEEGMTLEQVNSMVEMVEQIAEGDCDQQFVKYIQIQDLNVRRNKSGCSLLENTPKEKMAQERAFVNKSCVKALQDRILFVGTAELYIGQAIKRLQDSYCGIQPLPLLEEQGTALEEQRINSEGQGTN